MKVLVLNCGSSSLKYQLLDMKSADDYELKAKGLVERIGMDMSVLTHRKTGADKFVIEKPIADHKVAISCVFKELLDEGHGVISSVQEIEAVGHRVAHGGEYFTESAFVDKEAERNIEACCDLAPLHNPANLLGIRAMSELLPDVPQVAVFDTSFHSSMPDYAYLYAIPYEYYEKYGVRRYGFHGTSHKFVAEKACKILGKDIDKMNHHLPSRERKLHYRHPERQIHRYLNGIHPSRRPYHGNSQRKHRPGSGFLHRGKGGDKSVRNEHDTQ